MSSATDLALYCFAGCPYCVYVEDVLDELGLSIERRDIREEPHFRDELLAARGRPTVPVLRICHPDGDEWMPESRDIARYLRRRFG